MNSDLIPQTTARYLMRRTKATLIYRRTKNLRAVQLLLGHSKLESTVRYLGIEVDDALEIAEQTGNLKGPGYSIAEAKAMPPLAGNGRLGAPSEGPLPGAASTSSSWPSSGRWPRAAFWPTPAVPTMKHQRQCRR